MSYFLVSSTLKQAVCTGRMDGKTTLSPLTSMGEIVGFLELIVVLLLMILQSMDSIFSTQRGNESKFNI